MFTSVCRVNKPSVLKIIKMRSCAVANCRSNSKSPGLFSFFNFPRDEGRRKGWLKAVSRMNKDGTAWTPGESARLCSRHFITGKPSRDPLHPDFVPTINLDHDITSSADVKKSASTAKKTVVVTETPSTSATPSQTEASLEGLTVNDVHPQISLYLPEVTQTETEGLPRDQSVQTDLLRHHVGCLEQEVVNLRTANVVLINQVTALNMFVKRQQEDFDKCCVELKALRKLSNNPTESQ